MSLWFRKGSREDPVVLDKRLTAIERQLNISIIEAGGTGTGLIAPTADGTFYQTFSKKGPLLGTATTGPYKVPRACTLTKIEASLTTASSSGSVTARINDGASDYDVTVTSGNTTNSLAGSGGLPATLAAGDVLTAEITAFGTDAVDLTVLITLVPL